MRKIFLTSLFSLFFIAYQLNAQFTVTLSNETVDVGQNATVHVTASNFNNILGIQFSINYDSLQLEFVDVTNLNNSQQLLIVPSMISGPNNVGVKKGEVTFAWIQPDGKGTSVPNGTRLFSLVFKAIGQRGTKSDVRITGVPTKIEVINGDIDEIPLTPVNGSVTISGDMPPPILCESPACNDQNNLTFGGSNLTAKKGDTICMPFTVKNFKNMDIFQGSLRWDTLALKFASVKVISGNPLKFRNSNLGTTNASKGVVNYIWDDEDGSASGVTVPDGTVVFEVCFVVLGDDGSTACIEVGQGPLDNEWRSINGPINPCYTFGKITIGGNNVTIKIGTGSGQGGQIVCIPITVENFTKILGVTHNITWDATQLRFVRTEAHDLKGLNNTMFNQSSSNQLSLIWTDTEGETKSNGHRIYSICFELLCPNSNNQTASVEFTGRTEFVADVNGTIREVPFVVLPGSIDINCSAPQSCNISIGTITNVSCNGGNNGSINATVSNAGAGCTFQWKRGTAVIQSGMVSTGINLNNVIAGTYTLEISCNGVLSCSQSNLEITQPLAINIPTANVVSNASCGQKGAIDISNTSGGNGGFTYAWNPNLGNTPNPTNLDPGTYAVTVTDSRNCTATASFSVTNTVTTLSASVVTIPVKCNNGSDGSYTITATGGCPPYAYVSTSQVAGPTVGNLQAGSYSITITDSSTPALSTVVSAVISQPQPLSTNVSNITPATSPTANDGRITVTASGGTPNYTFTWSGPTNIPSSTNPSQAVANNLSAGDYSVTVTDANGCIVSTSNIIVTSQSTSVGITLGTIGGTSNFNGFNISCPGIADGEISGNITGGSYPITVTLKSGNQTINTLTINSPQFTFRNLPAGVYTIELTNAVDTVSRSVTLSQPQPLAAVIDIKCDENNESNGRISLNLRNTGVAPYTFSWLRGGSTTNVLDNIPSGFYNVSITDANGCSLSLTNIEVTDCPPSGDCYQATSIITPNGDNFNDIFIINCVENYPSDLSIFDRWGRQVYSKSNYDNTWKGVNDAGNDLIEGAYIWVLTVNFGQGRREIYKGTVTVIRSN